jgi:DNA-binding response OmpR family regulator
VPVAIRVLIVEDDPDSSDALKLLLEHEGFAVERAASVRETRSHLDACRRNGAPSVDVVVLDLGLPDFSPIVLADEFRRLDAPPAIIVHSAAPRDIVHAAAIALGAVGQVRKPSDCHELIGLIRAAAGHALPAIR